MLQTALTKMLTTAYNVNQWKADTLGGLYDKFVGGRIAEAYPEEEKQQEIRSMVINRMMGGQNATTLDDLMVLFGGGSKKVQGRKG